MTPLRAKYIRDLVIHGRSKRTQEAYTRYVCDLARYYRRSPELISYEQVTGWLYHLIKERQLSASSVNIAVSAVRFLGRWELRNAFSPQSRNDPFVFRPQDRTSATSHQPYVRTLLPVSP